MAVWPLSAKNVVTKKFQRKKNPRSHVSQSACRPAWFEAHNSAAMPTLVWKRRPKNGTAAAREAVVPDPVVSAAAAVPESVASFPTVFPDQVASSGGPLPEGSSKKRKVDRDSLTTAAGADVSDQHGGLKRAAVDHDTKPDRSGVDHMARSERDLPTGVTKLPSGKFQSRTKWGGKDRHIGTFDTPEQASAAYMSMKKYKEYLDGVDLAAIDADGINDIFDAAKKKALEAIGVGVPKNELPIGVTKMSSGQFQATLQWSDEHRFIGTFDTPVQASYARFSVMKGLARTKASELNADEIEAAFDAAKKKALEASGEKALVTRSSSRRSQKKRDLPQGVKKISSGKFASQISCGGKQHYIGSFDTPEQASTAFMSVRKHLDSADLSDLGAKEVEAMFDEAQKKAMEAVGGVVPKKMRPTSELSLIHI